MCQYINSLECQLKYSISQILLQRKNNTKSIINEWSYIGYLNLWKGKLLMQFQNQPFCNTEMQGVFLHVQDNTKAKSQHQTAGDI